MKSFFQNLDPAIKRLFIVVLILIFGLPIFYYAIQPIDNKDREFSELKCPENYENSDEKMAALKKFSDYFYDNHPDASIGDFLDARHDFWVERNCTASIKGYNDYINGNLDAEGKIKAEIIDKAIDEYDNMTTKGIVWDGIIEPINMTYGRLLIKKIPADESHPYFIAEDYNDYTFGYFSGDVRVWGKVDHFDCQITDERKKMGMKNGQCIPWVLIDKIEQIGAIR